MTVVLYPYVVFGRIINTLLRNPQGGDVNRDRFYGITYITRAFCLIVCFSDRNVFTRAIEWVQFALECLYITYSQHKLV